MVYYIKPICSTHYDPHLYNVVYDAPLESRTRMLIQYDKLLIGTVYRNSSSSTNNNYCFSRSSPEDPVNLKFRSAHVLHGPMRA